MSSCPLGGTWGLQATTASRDDSHPACWGLLAFEWMLLPDYKLWPTRGLCSGPPPSSLCYQAPSPALQTRPYGHFAFIQWVQEEGHAVRAQVAVLAGKVIRHLQQVLLLGRVALVGKGQLGGVDSVLGNDPVPARGMEFISLAHREPSIHLNCHGL